MRLIDADALFEDLQRCVGNPDTPDLYEVNLCILHAPTIDAVPVVGGAWEMKWHPVFRTDLPFCPVCQKYTPMKSKFCPNCGARMVKVVKHEAD